MIIVYKYVMDCLPTRRITNPEFRVDGEKTKQYSNNL